MLRRLLLVLPLFGLSWSGRPALADDPPKPATGRDIAGTWSGELKVTPQISLRIVLKVEKKPDGKLAAQMISPDQSPMPFDADAISLEGDVVKFSIARIVASFEGKLDAAGKTIDGTFTQLGRKTPLVLKPGEVKMDAVKVPEALAGLWEGTLSVGGAELKLVLRIEKPKGSDALAAALDSPDQGVNGIPVSTITLEKDTVKFTNKSIGGSFEGKLDKEKGKIEGRWKQGVVDVPLTFAKTEKVSARNRPQEPKPPFPYATEDVTYRNEKADIHLAGTLSLPKGDGPFPAVLLITGSGPQDRDETLLGHKPFLVLADALTRKGIAVLRVDDRGVGGSSGATMTSTSADFAGDALAGVAFLKTRKEIDPKRVGLAGHSEGGIVAPLAASQSKDVAFIVMLAGTGLPGDEILMLQTRLIAKAGGTSDSDLDKESDALRRLIEVVKSEPDTDRAAAKMGKVVEEVIASMPEKEREGLGVADRSAVVSQQFNNPWFRFFLTHDPRPALRKVHCPVLALNGEKDLQVPPKQNLDEIRKALAEAGNECVTVEELPGLNHLFQHCTTGSPSEYSKIEETFAPEALDRIASWILER